MRRLLVYCGLLLFVCHAGAMQRKDVPPLLIPIPGNNMHDLRYRTSWVLDFLNVYQVELASPAYDALLRDMLGGVLLPNEPNENGETYLSDRARLFHRLNQAISGQSVDPSDFLRKYNDWSYHHHPLRIHYPEGSKPFDAVKRAVRFLVIAHVRTDQYESITRTILVSGGLWDGKGVIRYERDRIFRSINEAWLSKAVASFTADTIRNFSYYYLLDADTRKIWFNLA